MVREEYEGFFSKAFMIAFGYWGLIRCSLRGSLCIVEGMLVGGSLGEGSFEGPFGGPFGGGKVFKLGSMVVCWWFHWWGLIDKW